MQSILKKALRGIENIEKYIKYTNNVEKIINTNKYNELTPSFQHLVDSLKTDIDSRTKKVFQYNAVVISLYGVIEQFVEGIIMAYLNQISRIVPEYDKLPQKIIDNHIDYSADLIKDLKWSKKYQNLTNQQEIVQNLHTCLEKTNYLLNTTAFIKRKANVKHSVVIEMLANIGISEINTHFRLDDNFSTYIKIKKGTNDLSQISDENLFNLLNDLAERRNDVGHGVEGNIIALDILKNDYIPFIKCYLQTLFDKFYIELIRIYYDNHSQKFLLIDSVIKIIDRKILCFKATNIKLKVGDKIICKTAKGIYKLANIEDVQVNKTPYKEYQVTESEDVAVRLNLRVKENFIFNYVLTLPR